MTRLLHSLDEIYIALLELFEHGAAFDAANFI